MTTVAEPTTSTTPAGIRRCSDVHINGCDGFLDAAGDHIPTDSRVAGQPGSDDIYPASTITNPAAQSSRPQCLRFVEDAEWLDEERFPGEVYIRLTCDHVRIGQLLPFMARPADYIDRPEYCKACNLTGGLI